MATCPYRITRGYHYKVIQGHLDDVTKYSTQYLENDASLQVATVIIVVIDDVLHYARFPSKRNRLRCVRCVWMETGF